MKCGQNLIFHDSLKLDTTAITTRAATSSYMPP